MGDDGWVRSYRRNQGNVTKAQRRALREHWADFGVELPFEAELNDPIAGLFRLETLALLAGVELPFEAALDVQTEFGRLAPCVLEIGFGMGENLVQCALDSPDTDFVGIEVHRPGLGALVASGASEELTNLRVVRHDVFKFLRDHVQGRAFDQIWLFFPEPWPTDQTGERRIVRPLLLDLVEPCLRQGATFSLATDVEDYAHQIVALFESDERWENLGDPFVERPEWRARTKYAQKGIDEGRAIFDLCFASGAFSAE